MSSTLREAFSRVRERIRKGFFSYHLNRQSVCVPNGMARLSYGSDIGALLEGKVHLTGGRVKLTHLHAAYPHDHARFNILYLVSSALPLYAVEVVRWAKAAGAKVVLNQNGVAYSAWTDDYCTINNELSAILDLADLVIYQSHFCKVTADRYLGEPPAKWHVLPNCVDVNRFAPSNPTPQGPLRLLVMGTHSQKERVMLPIETLRLLLDRNLSATLHIAGRLAWDGAEEEVRRQLYSLDLADAVTLSGAYTHEQAPRLCANADLLLHLKYKDPCPNVVIEAMACGIPVIGSDSGGMKELVGTQNDLLLPVEDSWSVMCYPTPDQVLEAVIKASETLPERRCEARRCAVSKFSSEEWVTKQAAFFCVLLALDING